MMLMYYREYRTFFHIALTYGISEAQCWLIVRKLETLLLKSDLFHLPGKKQLMDGNGWEVVLIDVAESPIERPKKNSGSILGKKETTHLKDTACSGQTYQKDCLYSGRQRKGP